MRYPFHTVCNRQWVADEGKYTNSFDTLRSIIRNEGFLSLWKGVEFDIARGLLADLTLMRYRIGGGDLNDRNIERSNADGNLNIDRANRPNLIHRVSTTYTIRKHKSEKLKNDL